MAEKQRFDLTKTAPDAFKAFLHIEEIVKQSKFDPMLKHLVKLRVSQINGCAFCVDMHIREARADGEDQKRLDQLVVWQHVGLFSPAEKAAFAWAEALTTKGAASALDPLHAALQAYFDDDDIALLTLVVVMINNWNRLQIAAGYSAF